MTDRQTTILLARRSLVVLAVAVAMGLALFLGSRVLKERMRNDLAQAQQAESANQASLTEKQADLANLQAEISRFDALRGQGLVGKAEREDWAEQLVASRQRSGLPDTLVYTLHAPKPVAAPSAAAGAAEGAPPADAAGTPASSGPQFHDLDFELTGIHEEELLTLLRDFQAQVKGRFRVNACTLSARTDTGLSARCTLRFFTVP
jgi:TolA-binding protein